MRAMKWILVNGIFAVCLYHGLINEIDGALNVALVLAWVSIVFSLFLFIDSIADKVKAEMKEKGRYSLPVPYWAMFLFDISIVGAFAWFGYFVVASLYLVQLIAVLGFYNENQPVRLAGNE